MKKSIIIILLLVTIFIHIYKIKQYKNKILSTASIELYSFAEPNVIHKAKITDIKVVNEFKNIMLDIATFSKKAEMAPYPLYQLIPYDKNDKRIMEIKCIPGLIIDDLGKASLDGEKYKSLESLINSFNN